MVEQRRSGPGEGPEPGEAGDGSGAGEGVRVRARPPRRGWSRWTSGRHAGPHRSGRAGDDGLGGAQSAAASLGSVADPSCRLARRRGARARLLDHVRHLVGQQAAAVAGRGGRVLPPAPKAMS